MNRREREFRRMIKDWNVVQHRRGRCQINNNAGPIATINLHPKLNSRERQILILLISELPSLVESLERLIGLTASVSGDFIKVEEFIDDLIGDKKDLGMLSEVCDL